MQKFLMNHGDQDLIYNPNSTKHHIRAILWGHRGFGGKLSKNKNQKRLIKLRSLDHRKQFYAYILGKDSV